MFESMIIGPSKVGKTALVATLSHATDMANIVDDLNIDVIGDNKDTQMLFTNALKVAQTGDIGLAGTASITNYEFRLILEEKPSDLIRQIISNLFGISKVEGRFHFMDSPGGAVFETSLAEGGGIATTSPYFKSIAERMTKSKGLILCVDANDIFSDRRQFIKDFFYHSLNTLLANGYRISLPFERIAIVLTKADLWAQNSGHLDDAESFVEESDPVDLAFDIIGKKTFNALRTYLVDEAKIAFAFTSVYGFDNGGINDKLLSIQPGNVMDLEAWRPFQILDPFAFLTTGKALGSGTTVLDKEGLVERL